MANWLKHPNVRFKGNAKEVIEGIVNKPAEEKKAAAQREQATKQDNVKKVLEHFNKADQKIRLEERIKEIHAQSKKRGKRA